MKKRNGKRSKRQQGKKSNDRVLKPEEVTAIWEAMCEVAKMPDAKSFFDD